MNDEQNQLDARLKRTEVAEKALLGIDALLDKRRSEVCSVRISVLTRKRLAQRILQSNCRLCTVVTLADLLL